MNSFFNSLVKFAGKSKHPQGQRSPGITGTRWPRAKKEKVSKMSSEKGDGVIGKLIERYDAAMDDAQAAMTALLAIKECGFTFDMPKRHIIGE
jgi:hypothetical protein